MRNEFQLTDSELDETLSSTEQSQVRNVVRALPDDVVNLSWRSDLNSRLLSEVKARPRFQLGLLLKPVAGLAFAAALTVAFFPRTPTLVSHSPRPAVEVETEIVNSFLDSAASTEVAGEGMNASEAKDVTGSRPKGSEWYQEDVGATL